MCYIYSYLRETLSMFCYSSNGACKTYKMKNKLINCMEHNYKFNITTFITKYNKYNCFCLFIVGGRIFDFKFGSASK